MPILGIFRLPQLPVSDVPFFPTEAMPRKRAAPPSDVVQHLQQYRCGIAMVAVAEQTVTFVRVLRELDAADRPMKVFASLRQARAWLKLQRR